MADKQFSGSPQNKVEPRKKRRGVDQPRRYGDDERPRTLTASSTDPKIVSKTPMRVIPDLAGFHPLNKSEIKRDTRAIEKNSWLMKTNANDEVDDMNPSKMIMRTTRPPSAPESNIQRKRRRYIAWANDPNKMKLDMQSYRNTVSCLQKELRSVENEEDRWHNSFQFARTYLNDSLLACKTENKRLASDSKYLQTLCVQEIGLTSNAKKRKTTFMRDLISELNNRQDNLTDLIEEYETLMTDLSKSHPSFSSFNIDDNSIGINEYTGSRYVAEEIQTENITNINDPKLGFTQLITTNAIPESEAKESTVEPLENQDGNDIEMEIEVDLEAGASPQAIAMSDEKAKDSAAHRRSLRSANSAEETVEDVPLIFDTDKDTSLLKMFLQNDEKLKNCEENQCEISTFFSDEDDDWVFSNEFLPKGKSKANQAIDPLKPKWVTYPDKDTEKKLLEPYLNVKNESGWFRLIENLCSGSSSIEALASMAGTKLPPFVTKALAQKRKKRGLPGTINLTSYVTQRTPRGVPLILSPLSQYPDKYVGAVINAGLTGSESSVGDYNNHSRNASDKKQNTLSTSSTILTNPTDPEVYSAQHLNLPSNMIQAENDAIKRCSLFSATVSAENQLRKLMVSSEEWKKLAEQSQQALHRAKLIHSSTFQSHYFEMRRNRKELVAYGLAKANEADLPLSPIVYELPSQASYIGSYSNFPINSQLNKLSKSKLTKKNIHQKNLLSQNEATAKSSSQQSGDSISLSQTTNPPAPEDGVVVTTRTRSSSISSVQNNVSMPPTATSSTQLLPPAPTPTTLTTEKDSISGKGQSRKGKSNRK